MTLQTGGQIWLSQIRDEFGGGNPIWMSNYFAGGPYVPAGTNASWGTIPSGGGITLGHFFGASRSIPDSFTFKSGGVFDFQTSTTTTGVFRTVNNGYTIGSSSTDDVWFNASGTQIMSVITTGLGEGSGFNNILFTVDDYVPNSSWTKMTALGQDFYRADAAYSQFTTGVAPSGKVTRWMWNYPTGNFFNQNSVYTVVWS